MSKPELPSILPVVRHLFQPQPPRTFEAETRFTVRTLVAPAPILLGEALAEKVIRNLLAVAGRMLVDDMNAQYRELDPDTAPMAHVAPAREAIEAVEIFERLRRAGDVLD